MSGSAAAEIIAAGNEGFMEGVAAVLRVIREDGQLQGWARYYEASLKVQYDGRLIPFREARVLARRGVKPDELAFEMAQARGMFDGLGGASPDGAKP